MKPFQLRCSSLLVVLSFQKPPQTKTSISFAVLCRGSTIGVCYGRNADDLPTPDKVAQLVQQHKIKYLRIYDSNIQVLKAFANTGVELMIGITNSDLLPFSQFQSNVDTWLRNSILPYYPAARITCITVGAEVTESPGNASALVVPAMHNVLVALKKVGVLEMPTNKNSTSFNGTTWCIASSNASQLDLQNAIDWACGSGNVDCSAIQPSQPCFEPDTLVSHASYAFNSYYQQNGATDVACSFGGTGVKVDKDPSYDNCMYMITGTNKTAASNTTAIAATSSSTQNEAYAWISSFLLMTSIVYFFI
ncbi:hypothetical protein OIU78_023756 [Salix suchowensis]|nr:hypothetical protein OIU78_023756 [Salix suchowensis]